MANNPVVNSLTFTGSVAGQATIQAQGIAGGITFMLPNTAPIVGQLVTVSAINGNNVFLGWESQQSLSNIPLTALSTSGATSGDVIQYNGTEWAVSSFVPGSGTVTSVALTAPGSILTVGGSPITGAGTLTLSLASQTANTVWAGPATGGAVAPTFRALVTADLPALAASNLSNGTTGSGPVVLETSPTIDTPSISGAVVLNGVTISATAPTSGQVLLASSSSAAAWGTLAFSQLGGSLAVSQINSKRGNGGFVQIAASGTAGTAGDVVTFDVNGNTQDGGVLLSALAPLNAPSFTGGITVSGGNVQAPGINSLGAGFTILDTSSSGLNITEDGTGNISISQNGNGNIGLSTTTTGSVQITTATGDFVFSGNGAGMALQSQNANVTIDVSGNASIATGNPGTNISLTPNSTGLINLSGNTTLTTHNHLIGNSDVAGTVTITTSTSQAVTFSSAYGSTPKAVHLTPLSDPSTTGGYWVTALGTGGFTANVTNSGTISFYYVVIG